MNYKNKYNSRPIRRKKNKKFPIFIITLLIIVGFTYIQYRNAIYSPIDKNANKEISFQVKQGQSVKDIASALKENNLIKSKNAFYFYTKFNKLGEKILAGRFYLKQNMNIPAIIEGLSNPYTVEKIITIQEGLTIKDIDKKLAEMDLIQSGELINEAKNFTGWEYYNFLNQDELKDLEIPIEGFLYPDTYYIDANEFQTHDIIYLALDNFESKISQLDFAEKNINQIITMASIIETEVFGETDRKIVSGILWKRLENGWPIGADATLLYITQDRDITYQDLQIDSPYNTRKNIGLPPGPISNPSLESIKASLNPTSSEYWFYLNRQDTGETIYGRTNEEHNANKAKYL